MNALIRHHRPMTLALVLLAGGSPALAASTSVHAGATAGLGAEVVTVSDQLAWYEGPTEANKTANAHWGQASYAASARFGALGVHVSAATRGTNNYFGYEGWNSVASATARAEDRITFNAPAGVEWVTFSLSLNLHGVMTGNGQSVGLLEAEVGGYGYQPLEGQQYSQGVVTGMYFGYVPPNRTEVRQASRVYRVQAGNTIVLNYSMQGSANAMPQPAQAGILQASFMDVAGGNTATIGITVLTPGASFLAQSGANYAPVPEPASLLLMGASMLTVGCMAWRRKA